MKMKIKSFLFILSVIILGGCANLKNDSIVFNSPGDINRIQFDLKSGVPYYSVTHSDKPVINSSKLGFVFKDGDTFNSCLLYTSDAADDLLCVDLGGRRII